MKILISGASGLIGQAISRDLSRQGHEIVALQRTPSAKPPTWDIDAGIIDLGEQRNIDAVIHLAGENIAAGRWSQERKAAIRRSRIVGTTVLAEQLLQLDRKPEVFIVCSAVGFYGHRPGETLTEESPGGSGFLAEVCREWEAAARIAEQAGIRVVNLRLGMVLSRDGGALKKMLLPFKLGLGGIIGHGEQLISWIAIDDVVGAISHILENGQFSGPVNVVSPSPVTNRVFTKTLGRVLKRPTIIPLPAFLAKILFGEMAEELLLSSTKALPEKLQKFGYEFRYPDLDRALMAHMPDVLQSRDV